MGNDLEKEKVKQKTLRKRAFEASAFTGQVAEKPWLSVVVIGRNEAANLPRLFASLPRGAGVEWLYVDSYSNDGSPAVAKDFGAAVFLVEETSVYGPGTGRYIGTKEAAGDWVLYLDGDMALRDEFLSFLETLAEVYHDSEKNLPENTACFTGHTTNLCLDEAGTVIERVDYVTLPRRETGPPEKWGKPAFYHGGAVLYKKAAVLEAGNWNPALYQLEELELFSRVRAKGGVLRALDLPMVDHYTPYLSTLEKIKLNFLPRYRGKQLFGAGQVVTARLKEGEFFSLLITYPYPFVVAAGLAAVPFMLLIWPPLALLLNLSIAVWVGVLKKWYYYLVYLGNLVQILRGLGRYRPFVPRYVRW